MQGPRIRLTTRRLMIAVAVVATVLGLRVELKNRQLWMVHARAEAEYITRSKLHEKELELCRFSSIMKNPYDRSRSQRLWPGPLGFVNVGSYFKSWEEEMSWREEQMLNCQIAAIQRYNMKIKYRNRLILIWPFGQ